jgi:HKD family nuclease
MNQTPSATDNDPETAGRKLLNLATVACRVLDAGKLNTLSLHMEAYISAYDQTGELHAALGSENQMDHLQMDLQFR